jgi:hypothetical protein
VAAKLADAREAAARRALIRRARVPGALRAWLGAQLIALGEHLARPTHRPSHAH